MSLVNTGYYYYTIYLLHFSGPAAPPTVSKPFFKDVLHLLNELFYKSPLQQQPNSVCFVLLISFYDTTTKVR